MDTEYKKGIDAFIVEIPETHDRQLKDENGKSVKGYDGKELITNPKTDDWDNLITEGKVLATPKDSPVQKGDTLYFSKVITREHQYGENYRLEGNAFRVPYKRVEGHDIHEAAYAYKHDGVVYTLPDWILVTGEKSKVQKTSSGIITAEKIEGKLYFEGDEKPLNGKGTVALLTEEQSEMLDIQKGDVIRFPKGMESPIIIDGQKYFHIFIEDVLAKEIA